VQFAAPEVLKVFVGQARHAADEVLLLKGLWVNAGQAMHAAIDMLPFDGL
jgi:hypothetical protein